MSKTVKLVSQRQFQEKTKINCAAVKAFEKMGFITPYCTLKDENISYYLLDEMKIIMKMNELLAGEDRPRNLREAYNIATRGVN
jgi:hypothetical protein